MKVAEGSMQRQLFILMCIQIHVVILHGKADFGKCSTCNDRAQTCNTHQSMNNTFIFVDIKLCMA